MDQPSNPSPNPTFQRKTWLITGSSSGLGLSIALSALKAGHRVLACARNPDRARAEYPELEELGGKWVKLDVTDPNAQRIVEGYVKEEEIEGDGKGIDVVVNNAGYALQGTVDDLSEEEMNEHLQTTFYGPIRVLKATIPSMRARRRGWILNMSSIFGFVPAAESQMYCAARAAIESVSETHASLLAPFGIRVAIIEPGVFRSKLAQSSRWPAAGPSEDYKERMEGWKAVVKMLAENPEMNKGDPMKLGMRVVEWVDGTGMFAGSSSTEGVVNSQEGDGGQPKWLKPDGKVSRLIFGPDAYAAWRAKLEQLKESHEAMREIAFSMSIDEEGS